MEIWDLYTIDRKKIGETIARGLPIPNGLFHLTVHIWPKDQNGRYLIQKRSMAKDTFPGIWAETGGAAFTGESSLEAAVRETKEELGIAVPPTEFQLIAETVKKGKLVDIWTFSIGQDFLSDFRPNDEVSEVAFRFPQEIAQMVESGQFIRFTKEYFQLVEIEIA